MSAPNKKHLNKIENELNDLNSEFNEFINKRKRLTTYKIINNLKSFMGIYKKYGK